MPQMANITIKKADGTTDVVYTALTPSAGDSVAAQWRANAVSTIAGHRPQLSMQTQNNGTRTGRKVRIALMYPVTQTVGGVETKIGIIPLELTGTIGLNFSDDVVAEAVHQFGNALVSVLIRDSLKAGFSPT